MTILILWLRSLLFYLFLFAYVTLCASIVVIMIPFSSTSARYQIGVFWSKTTLWVLAKLCGIEYRVQGLENIPKDEKTPLIILGKHQSAWETIAYPSIFPKPLCFVFKRELLYLPFFGWALASLKMIHINRGDAEKARVLVASQGKLQLAEGKWIAIYPEGTRTRAGSFSPYRKGGVRLALATQTNILPVAQNSGRFWPRNSILKRPGVITVSIGSVIEVAGKNEVELQQELETVIESEMHRLDPHSYHQ
ncbi:lysophospholipid acyltransferase family protein [Polynucleobacter sphagniphilus]|jgi:1-acyl-sn-glycerol-3-phosphate acyltransferase|uniref:1-acyl-sn-glycerol-3-phosphate acyltransferase n=2 Tax=Polynucleobacter sphagniphilus TaxID=1743169 RepID=A0AA43M7N5_9BURK|nr:lysophospholipid acyltransferase family protein [Polynucleobacter sphagniphilus]MDF9787796.1 1-acyl-sn-glycerol-3-phosphate acyltransferase [Polynucleobacter sphagniphilus]MDH6155469.1 1-acyl-sn-glycerol-3-phosphate acyltransferase [Polynucleobacter sphagniphilus]MDH6240876.1 1-acyl-sn-glycerol-3-phosphate acyltransferase [Polynucleobacter sphagniphilus]MDH6299218.1 1-acyl-sn-glycerol-3-phosphate acyltransferase [Polynucleobacter sphagniphilus]MDH6503701.1 1-acyl-sn-glycerol-3-phosphate acy